MKEEPFSAEEHRHISEQLQKNLGPEWLNQRTGPNGKLTYIEGKTAINIANEIFGFNGWSSEIKDTTVDFVDISPEGRVNIGVSVTIKITLKDGTFHEDVGYGSSENARSKASAFEKARKQAVTDATKRALRSFGNALGNCLYDKVYLNSIGQMAKPQIKFTPLGLYRHDQFDSKKKDQLQIQQQAEQQRHQQQIENQRQRQRMIENQQCKQPTQIKQEQPTQIKQEQPSTHHIKLSSNTHNKSNGNHSNHANNNQHTNAHTDEDDRPHYLLPEDSFSYEGDDEFFVQMIQAEDELELGLSVKDDVEDPNSASVMPVTKSPESPKSLPDTIGGKREPPLSDPHHQIEKRQRVSQ